jgi:hypothetical protein
MAAVHHARKNELIVKEHERREAKDPSVRYVYITAFV